MPRPTEVPIGRALASTAKTVSRAFDEALREAGGSQPTWLVLLAIKAKGPRAQRELADDVGIRGATLTHHLDAMAAAGLVTRARDPENRRVQFVELTDAGEQLFLQLRAAAAGFDQRLRRGISAADLTRARELLGRLSANVG